MATRKTITKAQAVRYRNGSRAVKSEILDMVCAVTGYHRDYARRALRLALTPRVVKARAPRPRKFDAEVVAALEKCWAVANAPAGKRLAPLLAELVPVLRHYGELDIDEDTAALLVSMSAATIDRRPALARSGLICKGRSRTKPGSLLKSRIPTRTWADHDENTPGFVEIDLVGHEAGNKPLFRVNPAHRKRQVLHHAPYRGEGVHLRIQALADELLTFVDGHSVAVTGKDRDYGVVCLTNRRRWVRDPRWGAFVVYIDGRKTGVAPLHGSLLREPPPGQFSRSPPALVVRQRPPGVQHRGRYRRAPGSRLRSKPRAPAWVLPNAASTRSLPVADTRADTGQRELALSHQPDAMHSFAAFRAVVTGAPPHCRVHGDVARCLVTEPSRWTTGIP